MSETTCIACGHRPHAGKCILCFCQDRADAQELAREAVIQARAVEMRLAGFKPLGYIDYRGCWVPADGKTPAPPEWRCSICGAGVHAEPCKQAR